MSRNIQLTATVDEGVKEEAQEILREIGLSMSSAIEIFLRQLVRKRGIPFPLTLEEPEAQKPDTDCEIVSI